MHFLTNNYLVYNHSLIEPSLVPHKAQPAPFLDPVFHLIRSRSMDFCECSAHSSLRLLPQCVGPLRFNFRLHAASYVDELRLIYA